jgi:mannose-6-phosphate isomerase-like protein (cupin superfamily)
LDAQPPAITVSGRSRRTANRIVLPPPPIGTKDKPVLSTAIRKIALPLDENRRNGWSPYHQFRGATRLLDGMNCHVSVLSPGHTPHPPHAHAEEELLIMLDGEAELVITDDAEASIRCVERIRSGSFVYYPAHQHHTIHNPGEKPITYLMFKWAARSCGSDRPLGTEIVHYDGIFAAEPAKPVWQRLLFQHPTSYLTKLHAHVTIMQPGAGYQPHSDPYDVAILVLSGQVKTLGRQVKPHGVIFYAAGELHGMENPGAQCARYLVFEFHRT